MTDDGFETPEDSARKVVDALLRYDRNPSLDVETAERMIASEIRDAQKAAYETAAKIAEMRPCANIDRPLPGSNSYWRCGSFIAEHIKDHAKKREGK